MDKMLVFYYGLRLANLRSIARAARYRLEAAGVVFNEAYSDIEEGSEQEKEEEDGVTEGETEDSADSPDSSSGAAVISSKRRKQVVTASNRKSKNEEVDGAVESIMKELLGDAGPPAGSDSSAATNEVSQVSAPTINSRITRSRSSGSS